MTNSLANILCRLRLESRSLQLMALLKELNKILRNQTRSRVIEQDSNKLKKDTE